MSKLNLKIVTPEGISFEEEVDEVVVTTSDGEIGILPFHANLVTQIVAGQLLVKNSGKEILMATGSGLLEMTNNTLSILTDLAEKAEDIDEKLAEESRKRAQAALEQNLSNEEYAETMAILEKSLAQLKVKRRHRSI